MSVKGKVEVNAEFCKGCGLCIAFCPRDVLGLSGEVNSRGYKIVEPVSPSRCTGCAICAEMCPDVALTVWRLKRTKEAVLHD